MANAHDPAFEEEKRNLETVESEIDAVIQAHIDKAGKFDAELQDSWSTGDYESAEERKYLIRRRDDELEEAGLFRQYKPQPYFGHMDFDVSGGADEDATDVCYIGKYDIFGSGNKHIVLDWRSKVGSLFYQKTQKEFDIDGYKYVLMLRRALEIKDGSLIRCETEYDGTNVTLDGDVVDPFLRTVLLDKRRQKKLTDIIRTIQGNQNSIIRRPFGESFAVQGCAGSGKTMILLHRLSYLLYNQPRITLENIKVITPNKFFDEHISDLSRELGLNKIERYSVDEYYSRLIRLYSGADKRIPPVESEKSLNEDMLAELYSVEFSAGMESAYAAWWDAKLDILRDSGFDAAMSFFKIRNPLISSRGADKYSFLTESVRVMQEQARKAKAEYAETLKAIDNARQKTEELQKSRDEAEKKPGVCAQHRSRHYQRHRTGGSEGGIGVQDCRRRMQAQDR